MNGNQGNGAGLRVEGRLVREVERVIGLVEGQAARRPDPSLVRGLALLRAALEEIHATDAPPRRDQTEIAATD